MSSSVGRKSRIDDKGKPHPLGWGLAPGVQGGGSAPARGWGKSPTLGIELGAEGAGAKLRRTSDGRVYSGLKPWSSTIFGSAGATEQPGIGMDPYAPWTGLTSAFGVEWSVIVFPVIHRSLRGRPG